MPELRRKQGGKAAAARIAGALGALCLAFGTAALAGSGDGVMDFILQNAAKRQGIPAPAPQRPVSSPAISAPVSSGAASISAQRTYCVRTCDGYYFAIGFARSKSELGQHEAMCASSCGDAEMKLYSAPLRGNDPATLQPATPAIERATDANGALYTALPTANAFRNHDVAACTCRSATNGLPQIPLNADPTLRNGDIVVMSDGLKVFRGQTATPHAEKDFVGIANATSLPNVVRQQMQSLQNRIAE